MTYKSQSPPAKIDLDDDDRELLQDLAREVVSRVSKIRSVQKRFGSSPIGSLGMKIIIQDPDNPDTVQICTQLVSSGPPYMLACWCEPPGVCFDGPCTTILV